LAVTNIPYQEATVQQEFNALTSKVCVEILKIKILKILKIINLLFFTFIILYQTKISDYNSPNKIVLIFQLGLLETFVGFKLASFGNYFMQPMFVLFLFKKVLNIKV
jgi:uncharacterized membrane protein